MIDLSLYAFIIPLSVIFLSSTILYEIDTYDDCLSQVELAVTAHKIADELVTSKLVESKEIVQGEVKTQLNKIVREKVELTPDYNVLVTLSNKTIFSNGKLEGDVYSVNRIVFYKTEPVILRVSVSR